MKLNSKHVALLIEDDYQEMEAWYPYMRLIESGAKVTVVGPGHKSTFHSKLGYEMEADASIADVSAVDFDAVVVPGGFAPDHMRLCRPMIDLVRDIHAQDKLVASICHGGWILCSAGVVAGKKITGYLPIKDDVEAAGGIWVDDEVVQDGNVITSRTPPDLPAFARAIVNYLGAESEQTNRPES
jgi:protease I